MHTRTRNTNLLTSCSANDWHHFTRYYTNEQGKEICLRYQNCWILICNGQNPQAAVTDKVEKFVKFIVDLKRAYDSDLEAGIDEKNCYWTVTNRTAFTVEPGCAYSTNIPCPFNISFICDTMPLQRTKMPPQCPLRKRHAEVPDG